MSIVSTVLRLLCDSAACALASSLERAVYRGNTINAINEYHLVVVSYCIDVLVWNLMVAQPYDLDDPCHLQRHLLLPHIHLTLGFTCKELKPTSAVSDRHLHTKTYTFLLHTTTSMADNDLATRAPESDLAEQSAIPGDTVVDQGASLGVRQQPLPERETARAN